MLRIRAGHPWLLGCLLACGLSTGCALLTQDRPSESRRDRRSDSQSQPRKPALESEDATSQLADDERQGLQGTRSTWSRRGSADESKHGGTTKARKGLLDWVVGPVPKLPNPSLKSLRPWQPEGANSPQSGAAWEQAEDAKRIRRGQAASANETARTERSTVASKSQGLGKRSQRADADVDDLPSAIEERPRPRKKLRSGLIPMLTPTGDDPNPVAVDPRAREIEERLGVGDGALRGEGL